MAATWGQPWMARGRESSGGNKSKPLRNLHRAPRARPDPDGPSSELINSSLISPLTPQLGVCHPPLLPRQQEGSLGTDLGDGATLQRQDGKPGTGITARKQLWHPDPLPAGSRTRFCAAPGTRQPQLQLESWLLPEDIGISGRQGGVAVPCPRGGCVSVPAGLLQRGVGAKAPIF